MAEARGINTQERRSWGRKAMDSTRRDDGKKLLALMDGRAVALAETAEARYSWVLYGLKLWRWSIRVTWWR